MKKKNNELKITCFCNNKKPRIYIPGIKYNIVKCKKCKQIYVDTTIKEENSTAQYENEYYPKKKIRTSPIEIDNCIERIKLIEKIIPTKGKILDVGTGDSNFLYIAKERGWDCFGNDLNKNIIEVHRRRGMPMVELSKIKNNSFDVITMFHVLEHIPRPQEIVQLLHKKLKKGGILVIDVPNGEGLEIKLFKKSPYVGMEQDTPSHIYYYSLKTLSQMLRKNNFDIVKKNYQGAFGIGKISALNKKIKGTVHVEGTYQKHKTLAKWYKYICQFLGISDCIQIIARKK